MTDKILTSKVPPKNVFQISYIFAHILGQSQDKINVFCTYWTVHFKAMSLHLQKKKKKKNLTIKHHVMGKLDIRCKQYLGFYLGKLEDIHVHVYTLFQLPE